MAEHASESATERERAARNRGSGVGGAKDQKAEKTMKSVILAEA